MYSIVYSVYSTHRVYRIYRYNVVFIGSIYNRYVHNILQRILTNKYTLYQHYTKIITCILLKLPP